MAGTLLVDVPCCLQCYYWQEVTVWSKSWDLNLGTLIGTTNLLQSWLNAYSQPDPSHKLSAFQGLTITVYIFPKYNFSLISSSIC